jgi:hypothetical protein
MTSQHQLRPLAAARRAGSNSIGLIKSQGLFLGEHVAEAGDRDQKPMAETWALLMHIIRARLASSNAEKIQIS